MKRTQRNLFIIMTVMVAFYLIVTRLPLEAALSIAAAAFLLAAVLAIWGRDYFIARRHFRRRRWSEAVARYRRFEQKLLAARWRRLTVVLYLGIYSFDGVAIARNEIAQSLINAGDLDQAVQWLRSAQQRDPQYALVYVNLALIAALRRDEPMARREMTKAVQLGFSPARAQFLLHRALTRAGDRPD